MPETLTIIGYGEGVGHGAAMAFAQAGFNLNLICRHPEAHPGIAVLRDTGASVRCEHADAGEAAELCAAMARFDAEAPTDVLLYNAVSSRFKAPAELSAQELLEDLKVDICGALTAVNHVAPQMQARGSGCLLFTGGDWAHFPRQSAASMAIGKSGLRTLALLLAQQYRDSPIRVGLLSIMGAVAPGTPFAPEHIGRTFLNMYQHPENEHLTEHRFHGPDWINP